MMMITFRVVRAFPLNRLTNADCGAFVATSSRHGVVWLCEFRFRPPAPFIGHGIDRLSLGAGRSYLPPGRDEILFDFLYVSLVLIYDPGRAVSPYRP